MGVEGFPRDYSLTGPLNAEAVAKGLANAEWYHTPVPRARMKELMQRSDGPATRDTILWIGGLDRHGRSRRLFLGQLGLRAVLCDLRRALRIVGRQPLARMRPWHRVQDAVEERRRLSDRVLHDGAQSDDLALEPRAASYRHHHHRARPGSLHHAPARPGAARGQFLRPARRAQGAGGDAALRLRRPQCGGEGLCAGFRTREGSPRRAGLDGDLRRR